MVPPPILTRPFRSRIVTSPDRRSLMYRFITWPSLNLPGFASKPYSMWTYMSNIEYSLYQHYFSYMVNIANRRAANSMIEIRLDRALQEQGRTFYWLAKETGISHTTLWRLKKDKAQGITFNTLERICKVLKCQPGDVLTLGRPKVSKKVREV